MFGTMKNRMFAAICVISAAGITLGLATAPDHHNDDETDAPEMLIGLYQEEMAFEQYHRVDELMQLSEELQQEAMEAQQAGDQAAIMELQARWQQKHEEIINAFMSDVEEAMPRVAEEAGVKIIAVDVKYLAPNIESIDVTQHVIDRINPDPDAEAEGDGGY